MHPDGDDRSHRPRRPSGRTPKASARARWSRPVISPRRRISGAEVTAGRARPRRRRACPRRSARAEEVAQGRAGPTSGPRRLRGRTRGRGRGPTRARSQCATGPSMWLKPTSSSLPQQLDLGPRRRLEHAVGLHEKPLVVHERGVAHERLHEAAPAGRSPARRSPPPAARPRAPRRRGRRSTSTSPAPSSHMPSTAPWLAAEDRRRLRRLAPSDKDVERAVPDGDDDARHARAARRGGPRGRPAGTWPGTLRSTRDMSARNHGWRSR